VSSQEYSGGVGDPLVKTSKGAADAALLGADKANKVCVRESGCERKRESRRKRERETETETERERHEKEPLTPPSSVLTRLIRCV